MRFLVAAYLLTMSLDATGAVSVFVQAEEPARPSSQESLQRKEAALGGNAAKRETADMEIVGRVVPARTVTVYPKVPGMIAKLAVDEGQQVRQGELLAEIDPTELSADVTIAKARVAAAQAHLKELEAGPRLNEVAMAQAELAEARALATRWDAVSKRVKAQANTVTQDDLDQVEANYQTAISRLQRQAAALKLVQEGTRPEAVASARADVQVAEAEMGKAQWRLQNCTIVAPINGKVLRVHAAAGSIANPMALGGATPICEIADLSASEIEASIPPAAIYKLAADLTCSIRILAIPDHHYQGRVVRLSPMVDAKSGEIPIRVRVASDSGSQRPELRPGLSVAIRFGKAAQGQ